MKRKAMSVPLDFITSGRGVVKTKPRRIGLQDPRRLDLWTRVPEKWSGVRLR